MPDAERIAARLQALWDIARGPGGGADRPAYSPAEAAAMRLVAGWARELGLSPALDAHGNLWALPAAGDAPLVTGGSHVDTVPDGGRYDGALGTVLGLELVSDLRDDPALRAGLLVCAAEEAPRFGAGTIGSRLLAGTLTESELAELRDRDGVDARAARDAYLDDLSDLPRLPAAPPEPIAAHAEVHVALRFGPPVIGVVTDVAAPRRMRVTIDGAAGHAGEVAMADRADALAAAAEVVLAVEAAARSEPPPTVATVGAIRVTPGAVSVVPGAAELGIDVRAIDGAALDRVEASIRGAVADMAARRGVRAEATLTRTGSPVALDARLVALARDVAADRGIPAAETWSGAGHDVQHVSALAPALLVFVPLRDGESHTPREGAAMDDILAAADVVARALRVYVREM